MNKIIYLQDKEQYNLFSNNEYLVREGFLFKLIEKFSEKDVMKTCIKEKTNSAIFIDSNMNVNSVYKFKNSWKFLDSTIFDLYFAEIIENYTLNSSNEIELKKDLLRDFHINFDSSGRFLFKTNSKIEVVIKQLIFLSNDNWKIILDDYAKDKHFLSIKKFKTKNNFYDYNINLISSNGNLPGINSIRVISQGDDNITFFSNQTLTRIVNKDNALDFILISTSNSEVSSHYLNKGIFENLRNNFMQNKTAKATVKKGDVILSIIGLFVFFILTILTFTMVFDPKNVRESFKILFDKKSFIQPWLYLLWFNFFISFFFSFIIMTFVHYLTTGRLPNAKSMWIFFVAAQIKATTRFLTGEAIIGTIIWAWYLNKNTTIRTSVLAGTIASMSIIRIPLTFIIVSPFMIIGQIYSFDIFNTVTAMNIDGIDSINTTLFFTLSWGGFVWGLIHHSIIPIIILLPFAHSIFNIINTRVELLRRNEGIITRLHNREMSIESMKGSVKTIFKRKDRIYRIAFTLFLMTIIEALEMMYIFKIVENYMFDDYISKFGVHKATYSNFLKLSGIRMMVRNVYAFPIINITPGNGMLIIEHFMKSSNEVIFIAEHNYFVDSILDINYIGELASDFSQQTAFITRFFNVYLKRFLSLIITLWVVKSIFARKIKGD